MSFLLSRCVQTGHRQIFPVNKTMTTIVAPTTPATMMTPPPPAVKPAAPKAEPKAPKVPKAKAAVKTAEGDVDVAPAAAELTAPKGVKRARKEKPSTEEGAETEGTSGKPAEGYLVVAKAVRQMLKGLPVPLHLSSDFLPSLNAKVAELIVEATQRATSNSRKTLRASDL
jgi:hypothetical protein